MNNISVGTIARTVVLAIAIINQILTSCGRNPLPFSDDEIYEAVSAVITAIAAIVAWWKNNSFSEIAIKADEFLKSLKSGETGAGSMTFDKFVSTYNGKKTDYDGAYGVQCVDLIKLYLDKVFGIKAGSWGNAKYYWLNFEKISELKNNFTKISNTASFIPKKGDIMVWNGNMGSGCGHVAICTGEGTTSYFYSYDQNWNGKEMHKVKHEYDNVYGVLRPKDQSKITTTISTYNEFPAPVKWQNGSTEEKVYKVNNLNEEIGSLSPRESAQCYSKSGNSYVVVYNLDGTKKHKVGFVKYEGGVKNAPPESKTYKNGSTEETVYADTAKKTVVGSLNKYESCYCLGKIDGMYLVLYNVNGSNTQKCGFVAYNGGVD